MDSKRSTVARVAMMALAAIASPTLAQGPGQYPSKPIRLIILSTPASGPDIVGRLIGAHLTEAWGQQVVIDPRPGASGIIGAEIAARSAPDGHTLVIATTQAAIVSVMFDKLKFDLIKDFSPISLMASTPFLLVVNPGMPAKTIADFVAMAKAKPGELRYGSGGSGSPPHLSAELFRHMTGIDVQHVPYKGVTPALTDTIAGQVHMTISVVPAVLAHMRSGRVRALGITSARRSEVVPEVPAISETIPGYEYIGWYTLLAPARTPVAIINRLNAEVVSALKTSAVREKLADLGAEPIGSTVKEVTEFIPAQMARLRELVRLSGAKADR
ncbi:MAG: Bug family tripartite tricarboxylate transporter substrate binding protein [bacterium]|jgi:tripartite-type tricarboxylate transporter receptor subunit TctC|nr:tripartite tricarboxylate transporter substrate binding protein [Betaproteobacteria bacterium]